MKLFINSLTSTVQPLKFRNGLVIQPTLNWACDYLSMLGSKLNHVSKRGNGASLKALKCRSHEEQKPLWAIKGAFERDYGTSHSHLNRHNEHSMSSFMGSAHSPVREQSGIICIKMATICSWPFWGYKIWPFLFHECLNGGLLNFF